MAFIEGFAGSDIPAGAQVIVEVLAVEGAREDARTGGFPYAARPGEEEGRSDVLVPDGVLQRAGHVLLAYDCIEQDRAVLAGAYDTYRSMGGAKIMASGETSHKLSSSQP
jgi:hypothetical protein